MTGDAHKLGEVLRAAREAKGVNLARVERDTKIRDRYLSALERGDYPDLPGAVYTKGFLRNYGAYLGLDPEYLIDLYRIESAESAGERPQRAAAPRPLGKRRPRAFVVTPGAVALVRVIALADRSPTTPKKPASAEFLIMAMITLPSGTMANFHACGNTTYRRFWTNVRPIARAASACPAETALTPLRIASATNAAV